MNEELVDEIAYKTGCFQHSYHDPKFPDLDGVFVISREKLDSFASSIIKECARILKETADDIDNGDIFRDQSLLNRFEERWSAGLHYGIEKIEERFGK